MNVDSRTSGAPTTRSPAQRLSADARALIADPGVLIDGKWVAGESDTVMEVVDPFTEQPLASFAAASGDQLDAAVRAARRAHDTGRWGRLRPKDRANLLHRAVATLAAHEELLKEIVTAETGSPIALSSALQVEPMLEHLAWFADAAARGPRGGYEQGLGLAATGSSASVSVLVRESIGVVAAMTPYNAPLVTAAWKVGGALAAGCAAVLLPSPRATLTSLAWARLVLEADLPPGAFEFVIGDAEIGQRLTRSPDVDMVTFTGSNAVGRAVMDQASRTFKRVVLELGGKSPNIVLPGTDHAEVAGPSALRFLRNAGQTCGATTRTFVPRAEHDDFVAATARFLPGVRVGDPWDPETVVGPLISGEHRARVEGFVQRASAEGAVVAFGGGRPDHVPSGYFLEPTLVGQVSNDSEIAGEELFGPVGVVIPYDDVESAIAMANASRYGLSGNVWGPPAAATEVARRIRSGTVFVNGGNGGLRADAPFGGYRQSGIGREAGEEGFLEFFEVKQVQVAVR